MARKSLEQSRGQLAPRSGETVIGRSYLDLSIGVVRAAQLGRCIVEQDIRTAASDGDWQHGAVLLSFAGDQSSLSSRREEIIRRKQVPVHAGVSSLLWAF